MLSCQQLTELVTDYTDGRLSLIQRVQFELHIGMCRHCREYLRQLRATASALGSLCGGSYSSASEPGSHDRARANRARTPVAQSNSPRRRRTTARSNAGTEPCRSRGGEMK